MKHLECWVGNYTLHQPNVIFVLPFRYLLTTTVWNNFIDQYELYFLLFIDFYKECVGITVHGRQLYYMGLLITLCPH